MKKGLIIVLVIVVILVFAFLIFKFTNNSTNTSNPVFTLEGFDDEFKNRYGKYVGEDLTMDSVKGIINLITTDNSKNKSQIYVELVTPEDTVISKTENEVDIKAIPDIVSGTSYDISAKIDEHHDTVVTILSKYSK